ncbi:MAG TPA: TonB family protein [Lentimicrobium sp.]|nr:TonB family protein [Lentimicrobium sp.]
MTDLLIYLIKAAVINAIILGFYYFSLRKTNKFSAMRVTLISAMVLPLLLPLLPFKEAFIEIPRNVTALPMDLPVTVVQNTPVEHSINWPPMQEFVYYLITITFLLGMVFSIISILNKKIKSEKYPTKFGDILLEKSVNSPFSFFTWVFLSKNDIDHPQLDMLLKHEFCHVKEKHSLDRIISGIFRSVLWFSPFAHITARRLVEVHEYQADANVLQSHISPSDYSDLVLSFYLNNLSTRGVTNNFSFHIKKRIAMINNVNLKRLNYRRLLAGLCCSILLLVLTSMINTAQQPIQYENSQIEEELSFGDTLLPYPDITPWVLDNTKDNFKGHRGKIILSILVEPDGRATDIQVVQSADEFLDKWAINKMKQIEKWYPAKLNEKPIKYLLYYPIEFITDSSVKLYGTLAVDQKMIDMENAREKADLKVIETSKDLILRLDPDTIKETALEKNQENEMMEQQNQLLIEQERLQQEQARIEVEHKRIAEEHSKIEKEQGIKAQKHGEIEKEHAKLEEEQKQKEKEFQQKEMEFKSKEKEFKEKEKEFKENEKDYLEKQKAVELKEKEIKKQPQAHDTPDSPAIYPGGDEARVRFISANLSYPDDAKKLGKEGTVYVSFMIDTKGKVTKTKVLKSVFPSLDKAAIDVINKMPDWKPALKEDKPVDYEVIMPIKFELSKDKAGTNGNTFTSPTSQNQSNEDREVFTVVEEVPKFPGGDDARNKYLNSKIKYPKEAINQKIEGTVFINFIVEPDGSISNAKVLRGIDRRLDEIALAAVKSMPAWEPGKMKGKPVPVQFNVPIKFSLPKTKTK